MYLDLRGDLAPTSQLGQVRTLRFLKEHLGEKKIVSRITPLNARRFIAWYRERKYRGCTPASATVAKVVRECRRVFREAVACSLKPCHRESAKHAETAKNTAVSRAPRPKTKMGLEGFEPPTKRL